MTDNNSKGKLWSSPCTWSWHFLWHHDSNRNGNKHNGIQFYNTQHDDIQHSNKKMSHSNVCKTIFRMLGQEAL
jgi:hypothetical protein